MRWLIVLCCVSLALAETIEQRASRGVLVKFRDVPSVLDAAILDLPNSARVEQIRLALPMTERESELCKIVEIEARNPSSADLILQALSTRADVVWVEKRLIRRTCAVPFNSEHASHSSLDALPNDPFYSEQWYLDKIDAPAAWDLVLADTTQVIAVVDVGVWFDHPDLTQSRWTNWSEFHGVSGVDDDGNGYVDDVHGYDFVQMDGDPTPDPLNFDNSHGTHVAGIAAATRNNGRGIAGVAGGARVMGVRCGQGSSISYGYEGVYYACKAGARIINCSWGGGTESAYEREIVRYVSEQGCVVVAAAGNQGQRLEHYPSAIEGTLSVAATRSDDGAAQFTNFGPWVKISAPGVFIVSTILDQNGIASYSGWQGTSMAAPVVAGVCALVLSRDSNLSSYELISRVCATSDNIDDVNIGRRGELGFGRVNAYRAVQETRSGLEFVSASYSEAEFSDGDGRVEDGELASLTVTARSFDELAGATVYVRSRSDSVVLSDSVLMFGAMSQGGIYETLPSPLRISLIAGAERGASAPLSLDMFSLDGRLLGRASTTLYLDSSFAVIETSSMKLGIGDNGALGYFDYARNIPQGPGLALLDVNNNALYHGSFFVAADGKVIDNFFGDSTENRFDWTALDGVYAEEVETQRATHEIRTRFDDRALPEVERLGVEVELRALSWNEPGAERVLVLEARIFNRSDTDWPNGLNFAGFICDWDVGAASSNLGSYEGGFDWVNGMLTVHSTESRLPWIGMVPIAGDLYTAFEIANREEFGSSGPFTDARKWEIAHQGIGGFSDAPRDISQLAAQWITGLPAGDSVLSVWAIVSGASPAELRASANAARQLYTTGQVVQYPSGTSASLREEARLYPNPLLTGQAVELQTPLSGTYRIQVYNILGQIVGNFQVSSEQSGSLILGKLPPASTGILLYTIEGPTGTYSGKLLHLK